MDERSINAGGENALHLYHPAFISATRTPLRRHVILSEVLQAEGREEDGREEGEEPEELHALHKKVRVTTHTRHGNEEMRRDGGGERQESDE